MADERLKGAYFRLPPAMTEWLAKKADEQRVSDAELVRAIIGDAMHIDMMRLAATEREPKPAPKKRRAVPK